MRDIKCFLAVCLSVIACTELEVHKQDPDGGSQRDAATKDADIASKMDGSEECDESCDCDSSQCRSSPLDAEQPSETDGALDAGQPSETDGALDAGQPSETDGALDAGQPSETDGALDAGIDAKIPDPPDVCAQGHNCEPGTCQATRDDTYECSCPQSFEGTGETSCRCPFSTTLTPDGALCRKPIWQEPELLGPAAIFKGQTAFDMARDGTAVLTWIQESDQAPTEQVWTYSPREGWQHAAQKPFNEELRSGPVIAALPGGRAIALFTVSSRVFGGELRSAFLNGEGYSNVVFHDEAVWGDGSNQPRITGNGLGHVTAAWYTYDQTITPFAYTDRFQDDDDGGAWRGLEGLLQGSKAPNPAVDGQGNELLAYADRYAVRKADTGILGPYREDGSICLPVRMADSGHAVGGGDAACLFDFEGGWRVLPPSGAEGASAQSVVDNSGHILTVWLEPGLVRYRRFDGQAWLQAGTIHSGSTLGALRLAVAADGNAIAAWSSGSNPTVVQTARYDARHTAWTVPEIISQPASDVLDLHVETSAVDNAVVVWTFERTVDTAIGKELWSAILR